ncbi:hypothetical protein HKCCE4037_14550 [Rhodobacterales bacterium HKCCE4037]|nr:hypothetical protein [Rhodobacterales bacterium HKCCE4037]
MTVRISLVLLASLLLVTVLATLSHPANAYAVLPEVEDTLSSTELMATGPLNVIVLSGR